MSCSSLGKGKLKKMLKYACVKISASTLFNMLLLGSRICTTVRHITHAHMCNVVSMSLLKNFCGRYL